jgi:hypothetical protein
MTWAANAHREGAVFPLFQTSGPGKKNPFGLDGDIGRFASFFFRVFRWIFHADRPGLSDRGYSRTTPSETAFMGYICGIGGVESPTSWDEGRVHKTFRNDLVILATLNDEKVPWTWVHPQGKGWVYYTSSGHDARAWGDSGFQGQLVQAVKWGYSASQPVTAEARAYRNGKVTLSAGARGRGEAGKDVLGRPVAASARTRQPAKIIPRGETP